MSTAATTIFLFFLPKKKEPCAVANATVGQRHSVAGFAGSLVALQAREDRATERASFASATAPLAR